MKYDRIEPHFARPIPRPPRKRYEGVMRIVGFDARAPMNYMHYASFVNSPSEEPLAVSFERLLDALRADGEAEIRPTTIFAAYRRHAELGKTQTYKRTN